MAERTFPLQKEVVHPSHRPPSLQAIRMTGRKQHMKSLTPSIITTSATKSNTHRHRHRTTEVHQSTKIEVAPFVASCICCFFLRFLPLRTLFTNWFHATSWPPERAVSEQNYTVRGITCVALPKRHKTDKRKPVSEEAYGGGGGCHYHIINATPQSEQIQSLHIMH